MLAANHEAFGEACCYLIEDDSASVLYATDTGLLPASTLAALAGRRADLVLLEETFGPRTDKGDRHLHLATFGQTVARLRELGVVTDGTRVVAVHLAHDNPPLAQLGAELAEFGAEATTGRHGDHAGVRGICNQSTGSRASRPVQAIQLQIPPGIRRRPGAG